MWFWKSPVRTRSSTLQKEVVIVTASFFLWGMGRSLLALYNNFDEALTTLGFGGTSSDAIPAAYVNWLFFDTNMAFDAGNSGFQRVGSQSGTIEQISVTKTAKKSGYVYIYLSNESNFPNTVYFDDLYVRHKESPVVRGMTTTPLA